MPERFREFAHRIAPTVLQGPVGERFVGVLWGLLWDLLAAGLSQAIKSPWFSGEQPDDALPPLARERRLPKYLNEAIDEWRARLQGAWDIWERGGSRSLIEEQFAAAGYTTAEVHDPFDWGRAPTPYLTHFWVYFPSNHPFGAAPVAGSATAGEHLCGISGSRELVGEARDIAARFRPGHVVCRQIIARISGHIAGAGELAGAGHLAGGTVAKIGLGIQEE